MYIRYNDVIAQKSFFVTGNSVLNMDRKPGSANRLAPLWSVYSERFRQ